MDRPPSVMLLELLDRALHKKVAGDYAELTLLLATRILLRELISFNLSPREGRHARSVALREHRETANLEHRKNER